jgi:hypothetical protein
VQRKFQKSRHQKLLLTTLYHHAEFQVNRLITRIFTGILRFFKDFFGAGTNDFEVRLELLRKEIEPWSLWQK